MDKLFWEYSAVCRHLTSPAEIFVVVELGNRRKADWSVAAWFPLQESGMCLWQLPFVLKPAPLPCLHRVPLNQNKEFLQAARWRQQVPTDRVARFSALAPAQLLMNSKPDQWKVTMEALLLGITKREASRGGSQAFGKPPRITTKTSQKDSSERGVSFVLVLLFYFQIILTKNRIK